MNLWTPYADHPIDLTKSNQHSDPIFPLILHPVTILEEKTRGEYRPVYSPPSHDTSPPGSINGLDTGSITEDPEYQKFERDALQAMAQNNGGSLVNNNPRMKRDIQSAQTADEEYRQQRQRNNMAAKRSRDRRKIREVRLAIQVAYLSKKISELQERLGEGACHEQLYCRHGTR